MTTAREKEKVLLLLNKRVPKTQNHGGIKWIHKTPNLATKIWHQQILIDKYLRKQFIEKAVAFVNETQRSYSSFI